MRGKKPTFFLLDGHSLAYRAFFALPLDLATKQGLHTGAILGFSNMLLRLKKDESPDYLAVAFDYPSLTFRHNKYEEYKATRQKTPPEMSEQLPFIKDLLRALRIPYFEKEGYEADDLIGTFARIGEEAGLETVIVTADADVYQLLSPDVKVLITRRGITNLVEITPERLLEDFGLTPGQWIDYKALRGDSSDNVPGVPGIGEKRALQLLERFGSLEELLRRRHEVKGKMGESLNNHVSQVLLSKELVTIDRDVPIDLSLEKCRVTTPDTGALRDLFSYLEFNNLLRKIPELAGSAKRTIEEKPGISGEETVTGQISLLQVSAEKEPRVLANKDDLASLLGELEKVSSFALLLFLQKDPLPPFKNICRGMILSHGEEEPAFVPFGEGVLTSGQVCKALKPILEEPSRQLITHDLKTLQKFLLNNGISLRCSAFDTILAAYLLEADRAAYDLSLLLEEYLGLIIKNPEKKISGKEKKKQELLYLSQCVSNLFLLYKTLQAGLELRKLEDLFYNLEIPLTLVLAKMELKGIKADEKVFMELSAELEADLLLLEKGIIGMAGQSFNLNSPQQLSYILFEKLKLPTQRKIKTGFSTDARVLQELSTIHPIASLLLEYRTIAKIKNTYLEGLRPLIDRETGKIHTTFNQAVTATGRLSSSDPNLQNIPIKLESGRRLRRAFMPSDRNVLLAADYSQIELRVLAHLSGDTNLIDAFRSGEDIHQRTAAEVFGVATGQVTPEMRSKAKAVNFGIIYGISDFGLAQDLRISRAEARQYIKQYFQRYPGVEHYVKDCISMARRHGFVSTIMGRRRYIHDINHTNYNQRSFAERMARNTPVQGSAADIIKAAMLVIDKELEKGQLKASMLLQVHDELIFEVLPDDLEKVGLLVKEKMEGIYSLSVPLSVDLKTGKDWYHLFPWKGGAPCPSFPK
ncbi:MAG: DNA polymerase I [Dethiobacteria bacterium]